MKKSSYLVWKVPQKIEKKLMRLSLLITLLLSCVMHTEAMAQRISIRIEPGSLDQAFQQIIKQSDAQLVYNTDVASAIRCKGAVFENQDLKKILDELLADTRLRCRLENGIYIIDDRPAEQKQAVKLIGKVVDKNGEPIVGATLVIKGTTVGVATDVDGKFEMNNLSGEKFVLQVRFIGMGMQEVTAYPDKFITITLQEEVSEMDEVVVVGYQSVRRERMTGSSKTVTAREIEGRGLTNINEVLSSTISGLNMVSSGRPGADSQIQIRGINSINGSTEPIWIVDGMPMQGEIPNIKVGSTDLQSTIFTSGIGNIAPDDIKSITVLKDAAATALYGSRAANGVVVVTTVAPKPGEMQITYNLTGGGDFPDLTDYNLCNAAEMLEIERRMGLYTSAIDQALKDLDYNRRLQQVLRGVDTYWLSKPLRNVFNHKHSLNVSGGEETIRYSLDLNYDSNKGVMKGSHRTRAGAGLTIDYRPKSWLQLMNSITYNWTGTEDSPYGSFSTYAEMKPYLPIYDDNGELLQNLQAGEFKAANPLYPVKYLESYRGKGKTDDITDNFNVNMYFANGLQFKGQFSITKTTSKTETFVDPKDASFQYSGITDDKKGSLDRSTSSNWNWNLNTMFYYNKTLGGRHFINATLGMNAKETSSESEQMRFLGFGLGGINSPLFAAGQPDKTKISTSKNRLIGFLGSVNYSFDDVYLFDASFRFDASSQFGKDKRWAPFWSVGTGINFHNYEFLKDNWLISQLKIRATYGSTGNVNFPLSMATTTYNMNMDSWFFTGAGAQFNTLGNPRLTWEKTKTVDVGFTLALLKDLIYIDAAYYCKRTEDLIDEISVRHSSGFKTYNINSGAIKNEGFEINLNATVFRNDDWMVTVNANLGSNKNTITQLGEETKAYNEKILNEWNNGRGGYSDVLSRPVILYYKGASTTALYAVRSEGIDPMNGKERFLKKNGMSTYTWDANDQVVVGDNNPDAQGSIGFNVGFKGLYLNASFMYQWGAQSYNETLLNKVENANIEYNNVDRRILTQRWMKPGDVVPFYDMGNNTKTQVTSRFVQDYNYLNFSSLSLGYDFKREQISKLKLRSLGLRFNMNDICRWSTIKEERGTSYPFSRSFSFSLNIGI